MNLKQAIAVLLRSLVLILLATSLVQGPGGPVHAFRNRDQSIRPTVGQRDLERLRSIMVPLMRATNHPDRVRQITVKIIDDRSINAGSAGGGQFLVTTGLLRLANDEQLRGVLAHEIAHDDLGHPARMQLVGAGVSVGAALLERVFPGSAMVAPIAGTLIASSYSRPQEFEADRHAVTILRRVGYSKEVMIRSLSWIMQVEGNSGGGILSTHPATDERIRALRRL
ncbi:MAG: M48 family metalloprotease [Deltaproteobacteria bacterium]|nr:M48 family metalloprotease [Deltaproteobacteria bacterium]